MRDKLIKETLDAMTKPQKKALLRRLISSCIEVNLMFADYNQRKIFYRSGESLLDTIPSKEDMED